MSLRDIGFILKKGQVNHGIATIMDDGNNSNSNNKPANEKATQAYKLFSEGKKPAEVGWFVVAVAVIAIIHYCCNPMVHLTLF